MSTETIERPAPPPTQHDFTDIDAMPPMDVIKCQCKISCYFSGPCELEATEDDLLCVPCRAARKRIDDYKSGLFSARSALARYYLRNYLEHCHRCDPEFDSDSSNEGANDANGD